MDSELVYGAIFSFSPGFTTDESRGALDEERKEDMVTWSLQEVFFFSFPFCILGALGGIHVTGPGLPTFHNLEATDIKIKHSNVWQQSKLKTYEIVKCKATKFQLDLKDSIKFDLYIFPNEGFVPAESNYVH